MTNTFANFNFRDNRQYSVTEASENLETRLRILPARDYTA